jgi:hypothetical protein
MEETRKARAKRELIMAANRIGLRDVSVCEWRPGDGVTRYQVNVAEGDGTRDLVTLLGRREVEVAASLLWNAADALARQQCNDEQRQSTKE